MPIGDVGKLSQPGGELFNVEVSNRGLITLPGGVPITTAAGEIIGDDGVPGSTVEDDLAAARRRPDGDTGRRNQSQRNSTGGADHFQKEDLR